MSRQHRRLTRLNHLLPGQPRRPRGTALRRRTRRHNVVEGRPGRGREAVAAAGAGVLAAVVLDGPVGWVAGAAVACGAWRLLRTRGSRDSSGRGAEARDAVRQLPLAAELLAACCAAGSSPERAADAVGRALDGPLGRRLLRAATELRLGGDPVEVWRRFGALPGSEGLARCLERSATAGTPAVDTVTRLSAQLRADRKRAAEARARRAAVLVTGPLGLCFLPAFLAVGVAPVVLGLAGSLR
nr:type II secretion system F family protein [Streptomyces sp. HNM0574]